MTEKVVVKPQLKCVRILARWGGQESEFLKSGDECSILYADLDWRAKDSLKVIANGRMLEIPKDYFDSFYALRYELVEQ